MLAVLTDSFHKYQTLSNLASISSPNSPLPAAFLVLAAIEMERKPCCGNGVIRGAWSAKEDEILMNYIKVHGEGKWRELARKAGLRRCGKSCRLRWLNYLRPDIKRGNISEDEEDLIIRLHKLLGNRWTLIAGRLPARTDNEIKNYWNTILSKRLDGHNKKFKRSSEKQIKTTQNQETHRQSHEIICPIAVRCRNNKSFSQRNTSLTEVLTEEKTILLNRSSEDHHSSSGFLMDSEMKIGEVILSFHHEKENTVDFGDDLVNENGNNVGERDGDWITGIDSWLEDDEWGLEAIASFLVTADV